MVRRISIWTLLGNWKNCGIRKWQLYRLWLVLSIQSPKDCQRDWRTWFLWFGLVWGRPEYWDESWRLEETSCHSNSSKKPSANIDVKNSRGVIIKEEQQQHIPRTFLITEEIIEHGSDSIIQKFEDLKQSQETWRKSEEEFKLSKSGHY